MGQINPYLSLVEQEIALILIKKTYDQELEDSQCQQIASKVLALIPESINMEGLEKVLPKISELYPGFSGISLKYLSLINKKTSDQKIDNVRKKINHILYGSTIVRN